MPLINGKFTELELPSEKHARVLFDRSKPWRYRVLYGGRNGYKDWSIAAAVIEMAVRKQMRFLFTREVQLTIADSAHQLLKDTIARLGYNEYFDVLQTKILCKKTGTSIIFRGLNEIVSGDIKSMEGIDVVVVMEAENLKENSFVVDLDPTIRKPGSEIWIAFNTKQETSFVYQFCVKHPPENMICEKVNYLDTNDPSMISPVIRDQAERMKKEQPELYKNVWLGDPLTLGLFFQEFGDHNKAVPFIIPEENNERLIGWLDHGIVHNTAAGLIYIADNLDLFNMFTYCQNGGTTRSHAEAILEKFESFRMSRYQFPRYIFYDYSMDEKHRMNEWNYRSDLDEYKDVFRAHPLGKNVQWIPANKRKVDGCNAMREVFVKDKGKPRFFYFDGFNSGFSDGIKCLVTDEINSEIYAKMDGDDIGDGLRYGVMGCISICSGIRSARDYKARHIKQEPVKPLVSTVSNIFFSRRQQEKKVNAFV